MSCVNDVNGQDDPLPRSMHPPHVPRGYEAIRKSIWQTLCPHSESENWRWGFGCLEVAELKPLFTTRIDSASSLNL